MEAAKETLKATSRSKEAEVRLLKYEAEFYRTCNAVRQNGVELHQLKSYLLAELLELERSKGNKMREYAQNTIGELQASKEKLNSELDLIRMEIKKFQLTSESKPARNTTTASSLSQPPVQQPEGSLTIEQNAPGRVTENQQPKQPDDRPDSQSQPDALDDTQRVDTNTSSYEPELSKPRRCGRPRKNTKLNTESQQSKTQPPQQLTGPLKVAPSTDSTTAAQASQLTENQKANDRLHSQSEAVDKVQTNTNRKMSSEPELTQPRKPGRPRKHPKPDIKNQQSKSQPPVQKSTTGPLTVEHNAPIRGIIQHTEYQHSKMPADRLDSQSGTIDKLQANSDRSSSELTKARKPGRPRKHAKYDTKNQQSKSQPPVQQSTGLEHNAPGRESTSAHLTEDRQSRKAADRPDSQSEAVDKLQELTKQRKPGRPRKHPKPAKGHAKNQQQMNHAPVEHPKEPLTVEHPISTIDSATLLETGITSDPKSIALTETLTRRTTTPSLSPLPVEPRTDPLIVNHQSTLESLLKANNTMAAIAGMPTTPLSHPPSVEPRTDPLIAKHNITSEGGIIASDDYRRCSTRKRKRLRKYDPSPPKIKGKSGRKSPSSDTEKKKRKVPSKKPSKVVSLSDTEVSKSKKAAGTTTTQKRKPGRPRSSASHSEPRHGSRALKKPKTLVEKKVPERSTKKATVGQRGPPKSDTDALQQHEIEDKQQDTGSSEPKLTKSRKPGRPRKYPKPGTENQQPKKATKPETQSNVDPRKESKLSCETQAPCEPPKSNTGTLHAEEKKSNQQQRAQKRKSEEPAGEAPPKRVCTEPDPEPIPAQKRPRGWPKKVAPSKARSTPEKENKKENVKIQDFATPPTNSMPSPDRENTNTDRVSKEPSNPPLSPEPIPAQKRPRGRPKKVAPSKARSTPKKENKKENVKIQDFATPPTNSMPSPDRENTDTDRVSKEPSDPPLSPHAKRLSEYSRSPEIPLQNTSIESVTSELIQSATEEELLASDGPPQSEHESTDEKAADEPANSNEENKQPESNVQPSNDIPPVTNDNGTSSSVQESDPLHTQEAESGSSVLGIQNTISNGELWNGVSATQTNLDTTDLTTTDNSRKSDDDFIKPTSKSLRARNNAHRARALKNLPKPATNGVLTVNGVVDTSVLPPVKKRKTLLSNTTNMSSFQLSIADTEDVPSRKTAIRVNTSGLKPLKLREQHGELHTHLPF